VVVALILGGCESVRLHDKSKAAVSATVKTNYKEADVVGVIAVQAANLDALHKADLKVVQANLRLQRDYALLELVDGDFPMAETWKNEIERGIKSLGFKDATTLRKYLSAAEDQIPLRIEQIQRLARLIKKATGKSPPECKSGKTLKEADLKLPEEINPQAAKRVKERFKTIIDVCEKLQIEFMDAVASDGKIKSAESQWKRAKSAAVFYRTAVEDAQKRVKVLKANHKAAVTKLKKAGKTAVEIRGVIKKQAKELAGAVKKATELADAATKALSEAAKKPHQVLSSERISAIVTLLTAAAGEQTNVKNDPKLAKAVLVVSGLSSLAGDISQLVAEAKAPSISNLLIELQHQVIQFEHAEAMDTLNKRRVEIHETKYKALREEAALLMLFRDSLCNFAVRSARKKHPRILCDSFVVSNNGKTCKWGTEPDEMTNDCVFAKPWKEVLKRPPKGPEGRQTYRALAAYTRIFPVRATQIEQGTNLVDLKQRENLATRKMALKAWNNLAAVPIEQIDAYYQSGLKTEVIADLIVKALGFAAITAGVVQ
jgi:hypothetical protein